ncbi:hypothetical protein BH11MYX1_BH11MYX1_56630 [soil metagenome]
MCSVMTRVLAMLPAIGLAACSDPAARVSLAPLDLGGCVVANANTIVRVIAYTPNGDIRRTGSVIADFPASTEQLGVELVSGGVVVVTGKTAALAYNDLANGTQIPIAMVPLDGFCRVSAMTVPRVEPLVAHAGSGVLVLGGEPQDADGVSPPSAEYYDPATARFTAVALPTALRDGNSLVGAANAELADGRVVVSSGQALTVFDPVAMAFSQPVFVEARSEHAALGLDASHILVTGGCQSNGGSTCGMGSTVRRSTVEYELDASGHTVGDAVAKPPLPATSVRFGGRLFDVGTTSDGKRRVVLAGAVSDPSTADQIPFSASDSSASVTTVAHLFAQVTELDGGALLTAFDPDDTAVPTGNASIVPPEGGDGLAVALPPAITGARLITLEDGTAVAIGGDTGFSRYTPTTNTWAQFAPSAEQVANWPGSITAPSLVRLPDGTVLVLGGGTQTAATTSAWLYRPSLDGPTSGHVTGFPDGTGAVITTPAPATATRVARTLALTASDDSLTARALVGGPRIVAGTLSASVVLASGGVALIAQQTGPARALVARLVPGEPARIERHDGATVTVLCTGQLVDAADLAQALAMTVTDKTVTASVGSTARVSCGLANDPVAPEAGSWGIAAVANGSLTVETIDVTR